MYKIMFICLGNICRSPMAEFVMRDLAEKHGIAGKVYIKSSATSSWEIGNPVYPLARRELARHGINCEGKRAEQLTSDMYSEFDMFVCMDRQNFRDTVELFGGDADGKISLLLDHTGDNRDVADPWYTGDFKATYDDVLSGCAAILAELTEIRHG